MLCDSAFDATMNIASVGTRGVPADDGGLDNVIEEVGQRLVGRRHDGVCCRNMDAAAGLSIERPKMQLVYLLALSRGSLNTLSIIGLSSMQLFLSGSDVLIVFNPATAAWLLLLRAAGIPAVTHIEGLVRSDSELILVGVGSSRYNDECDNRIESSDGERVWYSGRARDQELLDQLYAHAAVYWRGDSVGSYFSADEDILATIAQSERDREPVSLRPQRSRLDGRRHGRATVPGSYEQFVP